MTLNDSTRYQADTVNVGPGHRYDGVPAQRIEMEERPRNTCENGLESAAAPRPRPEEQWLLVTSASHMPRAMACFRSAGFKVIPYPVDYRTRARVSLRRLVASIALGLEFSDLAAHEWVGLATTARSVWRQNGFHPREALTMAQPGMFFPLSSSDRFSFPCGGR